MQDMFCPDSQEFRELHSRYVALAARISSGPVPGYSIASNYDVGSEYSPQSLMDSISHDLDLIEDQLNNPTAISYDQPTTAPPTVLYVRSKLQALFKKTYSWTKYDPLGQDYARSYFATIPKDIVTIICEEYLQIQPDYKITSTQGSIIWNGERFKTIVAAEDRLMWDDGEPYKINQETEQAFQFCDKLHKNMHGFVAAVRVECVNMRDETTLVCRDTNRLNNDLIDPENYRDVSECVNMRDETTLVCHDTNRLNNELIDMEFYDVSECVNMRDETASASSKTNNVSYALFEQRSFHQLILLNMRTNEIVNICNNVSTIVQITEHHIFFYNLHGFLMRVDVKMEPQTPIFSTCPFPYALLTPDTHLAIYHFDCLPGSRNYAEIAWRGVHYRVHGEFLSDLHYHDQKILYMSESGWTAIPLHHLF